MNTYKRMKEDLLMQQLEEATEYAKFGNDQETAEDMENRHTTERVELIEILVDKLMGVE